MLSLAKSYHEAVQQEKDVPAEELAVRDHHAFGLIGTDLSKNISVFQSSSLKVVPISSNAS